MLLNTSYKQQIIHNSKVWATNNIISNNLKNSGLIIKAWKLRNKEENIDSHLKFIVLFIHHKNLGKIYIAVSEIYFGLSAFTYKSQLSSNQRHFIRNISLMCKTQDNR